MAQSHGPVGFSGKGPLGHRMLRLPIPSGTVGELVVHGDEQLALNPFGEGRYTLPAGQEVTFLLKHS